MTIPNVYIINLSFGLAGTERRMANVWQALRARGNVRPILVVPEPLAEVLIQRNIVERGDDALWTVPDSGWLRTVGRVRTFARANDFLAYARARVVAGHFEPVWERIRQDPHAVVHIGLDSSSLNPPDVPIVYECMDSTLVRLGGRHYIKAAARRSVINCQTERIRVALEARLAHLRPMWTTVTSPNYFASYPPEDGVMPARDPMLFAFVGRLIPEKNPLTFLDAIAQLRASGLPARGLILGFGTLLTEMQRRIGQLGLTDVIEIAHTPNPGPRLREASVFVSLQTGDNYGSQSLLEAMGAGCAVVASDVGDTSRLVTPAVGRLTGFSTAEVAAALGALAVDPRGTAIMGAAASDLVRTNYTADGYAEFLESLYTLAIDRLQSADATNLPSPHLPQALAK